MCSKCREQNFQSNVPGSGVYRDVGIVSGFGVRGILYTLTVTVYPMYTRTKCTVILYNRRKLRDKSVNSGSLNLLNTCN